MKSDLIPITCLYFKQTTPDHPRAGTWAKLPEAIHPSWLAYAVSYEAFAEMARRSPTQAGHVALMQSPWETYIGEDPQ